ncbi:hypothetical protein QBC39DRAFT_76845 [Podospora conica]|nr:hypothetical protein QBC39DRAFT_76845 [Schizothecium conicum]
MGVAKFNADIATVGKKAADGTILGIKSVVSSTVHGQLVITIGHESLSKDFEIRATCEDPADYPEETAFSLSVPIGAPSHVADALRSTQDFLVGMRLYEVALALSTSIQPLLSAADSDEEDEDDAAEDSEGDYDAWSDEEFGIPSDTLLGSSHGPHPMAHRMRLDLRQVRDAGYKVGFLSDTARAGIGGTVSLSIRISKLGLSKDLMEAWDVEPTDYFVLLIRFESSYLTLDTVIDRPAQGMHVKFRVGKCSSYKPSPEQADLAFLSETDRRKNSRKSSEAHEAVEGPEPSATSFRKIFLSNSLDEYLNQSLIRLIKIRNRDGCTWEAANENYRQLHTSGQGNPGAGLNPSLPGPGLNPSLPEPGLNPGRVHSLPGTTHLLDQDHWKDAGRQGSFPLVAMQFAMRNFIKCNSFCLVCHRPVVDDEIEALRPYVCSDSLCLFQYLSMGFGPSTDHEILTQPLVVDLLVSLCYAALVGNDGGAAVVKARGSSRFCDIPVGLQLRVPNIFNGGVDALDGEVEGITNCVPTKPLNSNGRTPATLTVPATSLLFGTRQHNDKWIAFQTGLGTIVHHAQIMDVVGQKVFVEIAASSYVDRPLTRPQTTDVQQAMNRTSATATPQPPLPLDSDKEHAKILFYNTDFDSLGDANIKIEAMRLILDTLPSVRDMAVYLRNNPGCTLRSMPRVTPPAYSILTWIISSNRSCIYQIDRSLPKMVNVQDPTPSTAQASGQPQAQTGNQPQGQTAGQQPIGVGTAVEMPAAPSTSVVEDVACGRDREQERIGGMDGWVQFRFAQGSPDKELRFKQALQAVRASRNGVMPHPTLLGWHGSQVSNWHSILRSGLNFETVTNGRSFGNGVYFSRHYDTSQGYCGHLSSATWKSSELAVLRCVSLNEIINARDQWVSFTPHYVIAQPDWHQCRYLFVERGTVGAAAPGSAAVPIRSASQPTGSRAPSKKDRFPEERGWEIVGRGNAKLTVPLSAIPYRGEATSAKFKTKSSRVSKRKSLESPDSDEEDEEDRVLLLSDSEKKEANTSYRSHKRRSPSLASTSGVSEQGDACQTDTVNGAGSTQTSRLPVMVDKKMTDFEPGSLDLATLPRLEEPSFSNNMALRSLGRELSKLQSIQSKTPLHELGWYLHAEAVTNLFQWIVELHSFDPALPLAKDMKKLGMTSIVLEIRFPGDFPMSPPFVRVVRPRFLPFIQGGGGHVTGGGAMCMELLTTTGWSPAYSMESVLVQVRLALTNLEPRPGRIWDAVSKHGYASLADYGVSEAIEAYKRAVQTHGWKVPAKLVETAQGI